jgi:hypothetical protein
VNLKTGLLSYSVIWIGVLFSSAGYANAEASFVLPVASTPNAPQSPSPDRSSPLTENDQARSVAPISNIAPAEFLPPQLASFGSGNLATMPDFAAVRFNVSQSVSYPPTDPLTNKPKPSRPQQQTEASIEQPVPAPIPDEIPVIPATEPESVPAPASEDSQNSPAIDPELGRLRLRERQVAAKREPYVFLFGRVDYFSSDNILLNDFDPVDDQLLTAGVSLLAAPSLGPQTQLVASIGGDLARYQNLSDLDYNNVQFRLGIRQGLFPRTFGEISWSNQQFFEVNGARFLNDHSLRLSVSRRDRLASRLTLDSFYQFRLSFTDPADRSRLSNTVGTYLNYEIQPNLDVGLDYQFILTDFTQQEREDSYHQLLAQLSYSLSRNSQVSLYGGFSFGRSSDSNINFNSSIIGVSLSASLTLF